MTEMERKMEVLAYMVENGYHLMGETMEDWCEPFTEEEVWRFCQAFLAWKDQQEG